MRAACKVVIDEGLIAFSRSIERILIDPTINAGKIPNEPRLELIHRLGECAIAGYCGDEMPKGGVGGVAIALEHYGLLSPDVWKVYVRPDFTYEELFVSV